MSVARVDVDIESVAMAFTVALTVVLTLSLTAFEAATVVMAAITKKSLPPEPRPESVPGRWC